MTQRLLHHHSSSMFVVWLFFLLMLLGRLDTAVARHHRRWGALPNAFVSTSTSTASSQSHDFLQECESLATLLLKTRGGGRGRQQSDDYSSSSSSYYYPPERGQYDEQQQKQQQQQQQPYEDQDYYYESDRRSSSQKPQRRRQQRRYEEDDQDDDYYYNQQQQDDEEEDDDYYRSNNRRRSSSTTPAFLGNLPSILQNGDRRIGISLLGSGSIITLLGMGLFFNKTLMRLGNLLFIAGVPMMIGPQRTAGYFLDPQKTRATACLALGIFLVFVGMPLFGMILEVFGILNLFGNMFPLVLAVARTLPGIGPLLSGYNNNKKNRNNSGRRRREEEEDDYYQDNWDSQEDYYSRDDYRGSDEQYYP